MDARNKQGISTPQVFGKLCRKLLGKVEHAQGHNRHLRSLNSNNVFPHHTLRTVTPNHYISQRIRPISELDSHAPVVLVLLIFYYTAAHNGLSILHINAFHEQIPHLLPAHSHRFLPGHFQDELARLAIVNRESRCRIKTQAGISIGLGEARREFWWETLVYVGASPVERHAPFSRARLVGRACLIFEDCEGQVRLGEE